MKSLQPLGIELKSLRSKAGALFYKIGAPCQNHNTNSTLRDNTLKKIVDFETKERKIRIC